MGSKSGKFLLWTETHAVELGIFGVLSIVTLATIGVGAITLLEYMSHPMPNQENIGLTFFFISVAFNFIGILIIAPIRLNQVLQTFEQPEIQRSMLARFFILVGIPLIWTWLAVLPLLSVAAVLGAISIVGIASEALVFFTTALWMSLFGLHLYRKTRRIKLASLWTLFSTLILSLIYPVVVLILGILLVGLFGDVNSSSEILITSTVFHIAQLSPPIAMIYSGLAAENNAFVSTLNLAGQLTNILLPWVIYVLVWSVIMGLLAFVSKGTYSQEYD